MQNKKKVRDLLLDHHLASHSIPTRNPLLRIHFKQTVEADQQSEKGKDGIAHQSGAGRGNDHKHVAKEAHQTPKGKD